MPCCDGRVQMVSLEPKYGEDLEVFYHHEGMQNK
jgi:hypothetical protein